MFMEIAVAVNYILSHLYTKLPRRRVDSFGEELERYLQVKFQHHWFPDDPLRDSAYRCINSVGPQVELLLPEAAAVSGLEWSEIEACLPEGLVISIDPGHVACHTTNLTARLTTDFLQTTGHHHQFLYHLLDVLLLLHPYHQLT
ncbi:unnamed protein product [Heterobilharzia americana]|nr:unnamed protein product [Heterobilharzia americana]